MRTEGRDGRPRRGRPFWRVRVGDHRVVYTVHDGRFLVLVLTVAHRREVYRDL
ncbi:type II toxin-antitoxin system RelE/ParE family toxin [Streptomonospora nanhaiensis]|uniref:Type II toxin-antitoxin system RelE/ParE family toxin n=1 Tax=Streptomonospora nanhaiensis TaxID=1323731 RepID=A0ABY6YUH7_9ACTN|nr:type II toxin-antitoxin system RelE/ParE family toxin [Streptomonospora nanhaiensis]WAE75515.1 type II toxin-antitoxin system RelE/ParE family toxin [Streptomonospora nanhaiensis]